MKNTQFIKGLGAFLHSSLAKQIKGLYSVILSNPNSVTPQRHCGFFAPLVRPCSQYGVSNGASVSATHTRLKSLNEGMTPQNKAMPNMWGGSICPRVNPLTSFITGEYLKTQNQIGGSHA
jgi:hypothetical protein